ncbi:MAG: hypothetical protein AAFU85_11850 [Planctomycetota bacterium]
MLDLLSPHHARPHFAPDGKRLVVAMTDRVDIYRTGDWELQKTIDRRDASNPGGVAFSQDGTLLAIAISSSSILLLDAYDYRELAVLEPSPDVSRVPNMCFAPGGESLFAACGGHGVKFVKR